MGCGAAKEFLLFLLQLRSSFSFQVIFASLRRTAKNKQ